MTGTVKEVINYEDRLLRSFTDTLCSPYEVDPSVSRMSGRVHPLNQS